MQMTDCLLVLTAMKEEESSVHEKLKSYPFSEFELGSRIKTKVREYSINSRQIIVAQSGMGPVNAALTVAAIIEAKPVKAIVLLGVGGSIAHGLRIGDLVVSKKVLQHDYFSSLDFGNPRMIPGDLILSKEDTVGYSATVPACSNLLDLVSRALPSENIVLGTVVSGNEFVGTVKRKLELQALDPEAVLVDMEAAGIAQVSARAGLPFVVVKTVADRLLVDGTIEADFRACLHAASKNAAAVLQTVLEA